VGKPRTLIPFRVMHSLPLMSTRKI
jgi:hypothetical protein